MHSCSAICWAIGIIIFLLVVGTIVTASLALQGNKTSQTSTENTSYVVASLVLSSLTLVALLTAFVYYTVVTYNDGNWLHAIIDHSRAAQQRAKKEWADTSAQLQRMRAELDEFLKNVGANPTPKEIGVSENLRRYINMLDMEQARKAAALPAPLVSYSPTNLPPPPQ